MIFKNTNRKNNEGSSYISHYLIAGTTYLTLITQKRRDYFCLIVLEEVHRGRKFLGLWQQVAERKGRDWG